MRPKNLNEFFVIEYHITPFTLRLETIYYITWQFQSYIGILFSRVVDVVNHCHMCRLRTFNYEDS